MFPPPSTSASILLIGFRYLQNGPFNGITTCIMILFVKDAIQALRQIDNSFPVPLVVNVVLRRADKNLRPVLVLRGRAKLR